MKNKNISVQLKAFVDSVGIESATLGLNFFFLLPQTAMFVRMVRQVKCYCRI